MAIDGGAVAVKLGVELVKRTAPTGIAWLQTQLSGKTILIVGQPKAGKTSFARYLQYGIYADPDIKDWRSRERPKASAAFKIDIGPRSTLTLSVKKVIDAVGQVGAAEHVKNILSFKPDALIVVLDLSGAWKGKNFYAASNYLDEFLDEFALELRDRKSIQKTLKSITIVLNKKDAVNSSKITRWKRYVSKSVREDLRAVYGAKAKAIPVMAITLMEQDAGKSMGSIITNIALSF